MVEVWRDLWRPSGLISAPEEPHKQVAEEVFEGLQGGRLHNLSGHQNLSGQIKLSERP